MACRAAFSPAAVWEALSPLQREALVEACQLRRIPLERWHRLPGLAREFSTTALAQLRDRFLEDGSAGSDEEAEAAAAFQLSMSPATAKSRLERAVRDGFG